MSIEPEFLSRLIGLAHDASVGQCAWQDFTDALAGICSDYSCVSLFVHRSARPCDEIVALSGWDDGAFEAYRDYYAEVSPFHAKMSPLHGGRDSVVVGRPELHHERLLRFGIDMEQTEYFTDFLKPRRRGWHGLGVALELSATSYSSLGLNHDHADPDLLRDEMRLFELVVPHLRRALATDRRIGRAVTADATAAALDGLAVAVLVLDREGRLQWANQSATELIRDADGLSLERDGRPCGAGNAVTAALRAAVAQAGAGGGTVILPRRPPRQALVAAVSQLAPSLAAAKGTGAGVMLVLSDPDRNRHASLAWLTQQYGLTPAERHLAELLVDGQRLDAAAATLGVTIGTARTRLKQILAKTDCHRQAELVRLAMSASATLIARM